MYYFPVCFVFDWAEFGENTSKIYLILVRIQFKPSLFDALNSKRGDKFVAPC